jgi:hypothetical protein
VRGGDWQEVARGVSSSGIVNFIVERGCRCSARGGYFPRGGVVVLSFGYIHVYAF